MIKTFAIALVGVASVVSMTQAQTSGSVGAGSSGGGMSGSAGNIGGGSVVTPPASSSAGGASNSTSQPSQPTIDINRAQQPGIGVNNGASGNGSIKPLGR